MSSKDNNGKIKVQFAKENKTGTEAVAAPNADEQEAEARTRCIISRLVNSYGEIFRSTLSGERKNSAEGMDINLKEGHSLPKHKKMRRRSPTELKVIGEWLQDAIKNGFNTCLGNRK